MADLALLTWTFLWLSLLCVGGGLGVIPEMERQSVTIHGWLTAREFVDGYTLTQLTPGPNMLIAVFVGYRAHGVLGGILAGLAMFVPTSMLAMVISHHWQQWRTRRWAATAERALIPVGVGLMAGGVYTVARTAIHDGLTLAHGWLTAREFVDGYTLTQLTPGPNMLIAVFVGYRAHGVLGGILAGLAMFVPTSILAMIISHHWQQWRTRRWAAIAERALIPVGVGLMAGGVYTVARTAIHDGLTLALAAVTALAVTSDRVPPVLAVLAAGTLGWLLAR